MFFENAFLIPAALLMRHYVPGQFHLVDFLFIPLFQPFLYLEFVRSWNAKHPEDDGFHFIDWMHFSRWVAKYAGVNPP